MFTLKFRTENAAFEDLEPETARILREIADNVERGAWDGPIMDVNGNQVGEWSLT